MKKWLPPSQNNQCFLGTYNIEGICSKGSSSFLIKDEITLSNGKGNCLILSMTKSTEGMGVDAYMVNDSLFINFDWLFYGYNNRYVAFSGRGKIENDSIFFNYILDKQGGYSVESCNCKGIRKSAHIPSIETNPVKIYYNAINQAIIIDAGLQNQSLILEL